MVTCANCGRESPDDFTFCPVCASPLVEPAAPREVRKTVTVVFCDVTGSTSLGERFDPESLRRVMSRYFSEMRIALERHGGTVEKFIGDAVMAIFGVPQVHEDDALRAVRAAGEMREALTLLNKELERDHGVTLAARIGVNTGEVVAGDPMGETLVLGDAVNVAARLEQAASPGDVLLGADTMRLVRDAVVAEPIEPLELKGKSERVPAFRLVEVTAGAAGVARRLDSPKVGRDRQLSQLTQAFGAAVADRSCQLFTVLGTPGVGKSRLVQEFLGAIENDATVLRGRCLPYGDGITFFPVGEVVKEAAGLEDFDAPEEVERKICAVLGQDEGEACATLAQLFGVAEHTGATEETFWAVRRFLEAVAQTAPLAVVFDDIHWGEPTFLDLIEHIADWSRDASILLLCMARPELLDKRTTWGGGKLNASTILLEPLSDDECTALMANLLGRAGLPDEVRERILEAAEGTPLFVEEMLSMLIDDGLLAREDGDWVATGDLTTVQVPPTIQALLAARLDQLGSDERAAIERAAVCGKQFHVGAIAALTDEGSSDVRSALMGLVRRDLIRPDRSFLTGEDAFRFRHLSIRDETYDAIPKAVRAELHERFADWLERVAGDRVEEQEEIVGYHLERAYRLREELGPVDDAAVAIATRAAGHLGRSGERASERGDPAAAASLFRRATDLLPADHVDRSGLAYETARAQAQVGEARVALATSEETLRAATAAGQTALEWRARIQRAFLLQLVDPHALPTDEIRSVLAEAVAIFEGLGDEEGLAIAWIGLSEIEWMPCRYDVAARAVEHAVEHARRSQNRRALHQALTFRVGAGYLGSVTPRDGVATIDAALQEIGDRGEFGQIAASMRGGYLGMRGAFDEGRRSLDRAEASARAIGAKFWASVVEEIRAELETLAGDDEAAVRASRKNFEIADETGDEGHKSTAAATLALALCRVGRPDEAEPYARIALEVAAEDDLASQVFGRTAQARVLSARARHSDAIALARKAVDMFELAEHPNDQGNVRMELADVLRAAGESAEATMVAREALGFYERKGNEPAMASTRAFIEEVDRS